MNVQPMQPLFYGFRSTLGLPHRPNRYSCVPDETANDLADYATGYLSDGEILRNPALSAIADGYMTEGSSDIQTRRMHMLSKHIPNGWVWYFITTSFLYVTWVRKLDSSSMRDMSRFSAQHIDRCFITRKPRHVASHLVRCTSFMNACFVNAYCHCYMDDIVITCKSA